jgi:hypothetical protein
MMSWFPVSERDDTVYHLSPKISFLGPWWKVGAADQFCKWFLFLPFILTKSGKLKLQFKIAESDQWLSSCLDSLTKDRHGSWGESCQRPLSVFCQNNAIPVTLGSWKVESFILGLRYRFLIHPLIWLYLKTCVVCCDSPWMWFLTWHISLQWEEKTIR